MGVNPTPTNYKALTFGGSCSRNYGVYITGEGVFNAPERAIEMVSIPGRNGAFALDKGRFENIEVTYPAGIVADSHADFAKAISDFRNVLCSKNGYVRLEDEYNTGEYRLAIYKSGLEVSHEGLQTGEFDITFECKPQRFLTSGETAVAVASGGKVTNPTLFDARPQLQLWGYGDIDIEGQAISVNNVLIGETILAENKTAWTYGVTTLSVDVDDSLFNSGDTISVLFGESITVKPKAGTEGGQPLTLRRSDLLYQFTAGTADSTTLMRTWPDAETAKVKVSGSWLSYTFKSVLTVAYDGDKTITLTGQADVTGAGASYIDPGVAKVTLQSVSVDSSVSALGSPTYIDLDIGEAYKIESGSAVSVNNAVQIPAELPVLAPGDNTITYDNTFTSVKVLPRWWKV